MWTRDAGSGRLYTVYKQKKYTSIDVELLIEITLLGIILRYI